MSKGMEKKKSLTQMEKDVFAPLRAKAPRTKKSRAIKDQVLLNQVSKKPKSRT